MYRGSPNRPELLSTTKKALALQEMLKKMGVQIIVIFDLISTQLFVSSASLP